MSKRLAAFNYEINIGILGPIQYKNSDCKSNVFTIIMV